MARGKSIGFKFNGAKLHDLRENGGLTRSQLAEQIGVDQTLIGKWENGKANPSLENMRELSYRFGIKDDNYWKSDRSDKKDGYIYLDFNVPDPSECVEEKVIDSDVLQKRIAVLEEQLDMVVRHNDKLKRKLDELACTISDDIFNLYSKLEDVDSDIAELEKARSMTSNTDSEQVVKVLAKLLDTFLFDYKKS